MNPLDIDVWFASAHEDYNNPLFGMQGTGGSSSTRANFLPMRQAGANTRMLLLQAAASDLDVEITTLSTDNGHVVHAGQRYPYADFIESAS